MSPLVNLLIYLAIGCIGGLVGFYTRLPGGTLLGTTLAVIAFKLWMHTSWGTPKYYGFVCQVMLGVLIALTYTPGMFKLLGNLLLPMALSTIALTVCGVLVALVVAKWWPVDLPTAYMATSPGAVSALVNIAVDAQINVALIACFHFFRIFLIVFTAPFIFKLIFK